MLDGTNPGIFKYPGVFLISCQSCHQSTHGLYPETKKGADPVSLSQAKALNPDGHAGPIKCGTCHAVDQEGVPTIVTDAMLSPYQKESIQVAFKQATALMHSLQTYEKAHGPGK